MKCLNGVLIVKGYTRLPGLNYTDTFSVVVNATAIRVVLSLAITHGWPLRQLDVMNVFFNGVLQENVYMDQPPIILILVSLNMFTNSRKLYMV
jgi:hypothetical protein